MPGWRLQDLFFDGIDADAARIVYHRLLRDLGL